MIRDSFFFKGGVLGLILPLLAFIVYSNIVMEGDFIALYYQLKILNIHTHVFSLCVLANLLPFLIFIRTHRDRQAQGMLMTTFIWAFFILLNKLLV